jgi:hypothetical protein
MAVITFWNDGKVETSQSMTIAAVATSLAIQYNYKILIINTKYNDQSLERAFEPKNNVSNMFSKGKMDLDTGLSGVAKAIMSNKTSPEIITNYTKIILKNLELLTEMKTTKEEFDRYMNCLKDIIKLANRYFDIVLVDLEGSIESVKIKQVMELATVNVITLTQNLNVIDNYNEQKAKNAILQGTNKIISIGKYDSKSKYTIKNISKYIKEKNVFGIPYNTLFGMEAPEGKVADYVIRFRRINQNHVNADFINSVNKETEEINVLFPICRSVAENNNGLPDYP